MSEDNKLFRCAGVSLGKTGYKVRFASDMTRVKVLMKTGNSDIELVELPSAMSKDAAVAFLKQSSLMDKPEYREAILNADLKYDTEAKPAKVAKSKKTATVAVARTSKKAAPSIEDIRARARAKETPAEELGAIFATMVAEHRKEVTEG